MLITSYTNPLKELKVSHVSIVSDFNVIEDNNSLTNGVKSTSKVFINFFSTLAKSCLVKLPDSPRKHSLKPIFYHYPNSVIQESNQLKSHLGFAIKMKHIKILDFYYFWLCFAYQNLQNGYFWISLLTILFEGKETCAMCGLPIQNNNSVIHASLTFLFEFFELKEKAQIKRKINRKIVYMINQCYYLDLPKN